MKKLNVLFFTPYYHQSRGNSATARRLEQGLNEKGVNVTVFAYEEDSITRELIAQMEQADLFHVLQFARFTNWCEKNDFKLDRPYVITSGGTDINHSLKEHKEKYLPILKEAKAITVFTDDAKTNLLKILKFHENFVQVIPQTPYFPERGKGGKDGIHFPSGFPKILLPAGLRPVKDVLFAVASIQKLQMVYPDIIFLILGANLDDQVYKQVNSLTSKFEWFHYRSEIDLSLMRDVYQWADIVVNTSISEGQSTSLLEAMHEKKPVAARNIPGNTSIISHGYNGLLFDDQEGLYRSLKRLITDRQLYERICFHGYQTVKEKHTMKQEIESYLQIYTQ
ncbi:glycosyltransferase [Fictibacillus barbaricus]|uniref:Glycosyltransferase involved in cell wall biosynthesis n=1 Tax=Fictibacillus barbaricus TaxID=182136 RepID=A0ABU1TYF4_9BACL|nr:glycosyltransferase [Fictibacillus barbaricus]MDR7072257.1 glycosyltransferase involved in cell wall biosynthesis [Fictibacillus barbaricus]